MNTNWDHLRYFLALAEHGTLSAAAGSLGVSHSTVLRRVRAFESQLQSRLFTHTRDGYHLTGIGERLFLEADKVRKTLSVVSRDLAGADDSLDGEVTLTTTDTLAQHVLPKLLARLTRRFQGIRFTVLMANRLSDLENREVDIAIRTGTRAPDNLIGRRIATIEFSAVASRSYIRKHRLASFPKQDATQRFILLDESYAGTPFYRWLDRNRSDAAPFIVVNNFLSAAAMAREGLGITVLPSYMLSRETSLEALPTDSTIRSNQLWVLSHPDQRNTRKVRVVRQYFYDELPAYFPSNQGSTA